MAPSLTEVLFALGAGSRLVGVTRFCDVPEAAKAKPKVGGFIDPDLEAIMALKPDLVLGLTSGGDPAIAAKLDGASIPYRFLKMETYDETLAGIERVGTLIGASSDAKALRARLAQATASVEVHGVAPRVLFVLGHKPTVAAGPGTLYDALIVRAGGRNAVEGEQTYPRLDAEQVLRLNPQVIIDAAMVGRDRDASAYWKAFPTIAAVESGRVHSVDDSSLLRPGPRLDRAFRLLRGAIASP